MNTTDKIDAQIIVEEKIVKLNGEIQIRSNSCKNNTKKSFS